MPPPSHDLKGMNSYPMPTFDVVRYEKPIEAAFGQQARTSNTAELAYVSLNSSPDMMYFVVRPKGSQIPATLLASGNNDRPNQHIQRIKAKKHNMEITKIVMSINTSSNVLQSSSFVELDRRELDRITLENCCSLSAFPYSRLAFRKYRHFVLLKMEQLSGLFSTPGAADSLTIQGDVHCKNNTICPYEPNTCELLMYSYYFNKRWTITRTSSSVESVTVDKSVAGAIRNGR